MAVFAVLAVLTLGLVPAGEGDGAALPVDLPEVHAGPVAVDGGTVAVDGDLPVALPVAVDTGLGLCAGCPGVSVAVGGSPPAEPSPAARDGPLSVVADAPPAAVAAGSSLLATLAGYALWLAARPFVGLFSRIEDDALASHPLRRQAIDFIAANPGASVQDVRRSLGIAWGTAIYHLGRLERAGLVAVRRAGGRAGHWPLGQAPARDGLTPTAKALADLVLGRPGLSQGELAVLAGIGAPAACKQLQRLESAGLVTAQRAGRARLYHSTGRLDAMMAAAT